MHKIILLFSLLAFSYSQQAEITNIQAAQRTDGSQIVDITYDLLPDQVFEFFEVTVKVSLDGGISYFPMQNVIGDLGDIIEPGTGKTLTWNFGQQYGGSYSNQIKIKIEGSSFAIVDNNSNQELPFEMVSVSAGEYTFGENDEIRTIDYDYEMMKYPATDMDYVLFMLDKLAESNTNGAIQCDTCMEDCVLFMFYAGLTWEVATEWCYGNPDSDSGCGDSCSDVEDSFTVNLTESALVGYYPGDSNYPAGDYTYINFNDSKISWNGEIFEVQEGNVNHPVTGVTWFGAWAFAIHYGMEIPDQYEWEKAARGNTGYDYPWGDQLNIENANFNDTYVGFYGIGTSTSTVGSFNGSTYNCEYNGGNSIFITEIADPQNSSEAGRFVELFNGSDYAINLDGYSMQRWTNSNEEPSSPIELSGTIQANDFFIICNNADNYNTTYGLNCDQEVSTGGVADSNGDDTIALTWLGVILDIFGVPGQDGSGTGAEFEDGRAERAPWTVGASNTWIESDWIVDNDSGLGEGPQYAPQDFDPGFWIGLGADLSNNTCPDLITIDSHSIYGAYDMAGNVWEIIKNDDDNYFTKGGAFNSIANDLKSWNHQSYTATTTSTAIGFRCLRVTNQPRSNKSSRGINRKHHSLDSQKKIDKSFKNK
ncbi:SUMF1/EgtB/PvdO family nonheme iron enzyme [Candidatus Marinimicrobia bacterium]|nr:SUMF1/EgtB/PvdO family nonheme iron enzyme [Candidatus Neomarinimicrobiota bacterium]